MFNEFVFLLDNNYNKLLFGHIAQLVRATDS